MVPDFKGGDGLWVYRVQVDGVRNFTLSGSVYSGILQRTNSTGIVQKTKPTYTGCTSSFKGFQEFVEWSQRQVGYGEGFHLDKDLLYRGNKEYGEDTCVFLPLDLNNLIIKRDAKRGLYPIGVSYYKGKGYKVSFSVGGRVRYYGYHKTPIEAFLTYKQNKECLIRELAVKWRSKIDPRAYEALMSYEVLITD